MKCQGYGYTCLLNVDGPGCCSSRQEEKRPCVPCDETYLKKSSGYYNQAGSCDFIPGNGNFVTFSDISQTFKHVNIERIRPAFIIFLQ